MMNITDSNDVRAEDAQTRYEACGPKKAHTVLTVDAGPIGPNETRRCDDCFLADLPVPRSVWLQLQPELRPALTAAPGVFRALRAPHQAVRILGNWAKARALLASVRGWRGRSASLAASRCWRRRRRRRGTDRRRSATAAASTIAPSTTTTTSTATCCRRRRRRRRRRGTDLRRSATAAASTIAPSTTTSTATCCRRRSFVGEAVRGSRPALFALRRRRGWSPRRRSHLHRGCGRASHSGVTT